nr:MAG TPA: hypothetical protein [Caudoviricetes sp.]
MEFFLIACGKFQADIFLVIRIRAIVHRKQTRPGSLTHLRGFFYMFLYTVVQSKVFQVIST